MIKLIQLKQVMRNKRFLMFTIFVPCCWFLFMIALSKNDNFGHTFLYYVWYVTSALMGIIGNSIVTFGMRITTSKRYYLLQFKISNYSILKYLLDSLFSQLILNLLIVCMISILGIILGVINISYNFLIIFLALNFFGIYVSLIGFTIGMLMKKTVFEAGGFPIMMVVAIMITPFKTFMVNNFVDYLTYFQKIFPGYYLINLSSNIIQNNNIGLSLLNFTVSIFLTSVPFILLLWFKFIKEV
ncbi:hypothetical protein [Apilactobacillus ozensis]|uniref:hypothetical protein n=1 Tax=Apilactobacillus ozensis TaxID=866801 RepID=UPI00200AA86A|nr:hypothetical protein [Apilactobacillus ozensis]MCK8606852.1 hypothetical protein [Apilactobacillus ozensis]